MLHITNGDAAAQLIRATGEAGEVLPWRDVLHEGPVPAGLSDDALASVRAEFIGSMGWADRADALRDLALRDARLAVAGASEEVVLWFEHDLYDQLQLVQILARLAIAAARPARLALVQSDRHLTDLTPEALALLGRSRVPVSAAMLNEAAAAWRAFGAPHPAELERYGAVHPVPVLVHVTPAFGRLLEEYPATDDGLARSERQLLESLAEGPRIARDAYLASHHAREAAIFAGDLVWAGYAARLGAGAGALVAGSDPAALTHPAADLRRFMRSSLSLTGPGRRALEGTLDWAASGGCDRWIGGVRLTGPHPRWRWDRAMRAIRPG